MDVEKKKKMVKRKTSNDQSDYTKVDYLFEMAKYFGYEIE